MVAHKNFTSELQKILPDTIILDWEKSPDLYFPRHSCKLAAIDKNCPDNKFFIYFDGGLGEDLVDADVCAAAQSIIDGLKRKQTNN